VREDVVTNEKGHPLFLPYSQPRNVHVLPVKHVPPILCILELVHAAVESELPTHPAPVSLLGAVRCPRAALRRRSRRYHIPRAAAAPQRTPARNREDRADLLDAGVHCLAAGWTCRSSNGPGRRCTLIDACTTALVVDAARQSQGAA
jgi:hypothetical protein